MAGREFRIALTTKLTDYEIDAGSITVPGNATRAQLSKLVNELLDREKPLPFDFIVNHQFLRGTLEDIVSEHNLPTEEELSVEYVLALLPPQPQATASENDWISSLDAVDDRDLILAGSYDHLGRVFDVDAKLRTTLQGHTAPVRDICHVKRSDELQVATVSQDETLVLHTLDSKSLATTRMITCEGHTAAVNCVASRADGSMVCTGSWDHTLKVWATEPEMDETEDAPAGKKKGKTSIQQHTVENPLLSMDASVAAVTDVVWPYDETIFTGSDDHAIKRWDITTGACACSMTGPKVVTSLAMQGPTQKLAAGAFDGNVRVYSTANNAIKVSVLLQCHKAPVSCVAWNPNNPHQLITSSLSEQPNMRIWDIRSPRVPVCGVTSHESKVLSVLWTRSNNIVSGGEDGNLIVHGFQVPE